MLLLQVKEAVTTSALLKLPQNMPRAEKNARVLAVIQQLVRLHALLLFVTSQRTPTKTPTFPLSARYCFKIKFGRSNDTATWIANL